MLTWTKENGEWGLNNFDIKKVPRELYGAIYKLHDYEKTGLELEEVQGLMECRERIVKQLSSKYRKVECDEDLEWNRAINETIAIVKAGGKNE